MRLADFEINEGDIFILEERDNDAKKYTGRKIETIAAYIFKTKGQLFWPQRDIDKYGFQVIQFGLKNK